MPEPEKGVKPEEPVVPPETPPVPEEPPKVTPPAEGVKPEEPPKEGVEPEKPVKLEEEMPWGKDPRFQEFIEAKNALKELQGDPDFATFLAFKRNKEAMQVKEGKPDYSKMTADEYAEEVASRAERRADDRFTSLVESNKEGDRLSAEAIKFAGDAGITKEVFQKEWSPKIIAYYEGVSKEIPESAMDSFVKAHPPKDVFKALYFDKAGEAGVTKYKQDIEKAKGAGFEEEGGVSREGAPEGFESAFEQNWKKAFGNATELPQSALEKK